eukprot:c14360_g1_i1 orf=34-1134(+)
MLSSHRFSYFPLLVTVALMIICCCCIKAPAQTPSPESDLPSWWRFCEFLSANLTLMSSGKPAHSSITLPDGRNLTLFGQSSFPVSAELSSPYSFTVTTHNKMDLEPSLAFIFASYPPPQAAAPSCVQYMDLSLSGKLDLCSCKPPPVIALCTPPQQVLQAQDVPSTPVDEDSQKDEVSLAYDASTAELLVQVVDYRKGLKSKVMFNLSTHNFIPDSYESTIFFVGYISRGEASIKVAPSPPLSPPPGIEESTIPTHNHDSLPKNDTHTNHTKVIVGVVMGALGIGTLLGFIIPALLIKKRHGRRPLVNSPTPGHPIPLVVRSPFTHDDLDSGVAPMMSTPPFPPIRSDAFQQTSGSTSWLQPINPR